MLESPSVSLPAAPSVEQTDLNELATGTGIALGGRFTGRFLDLTRQALLVRLISQTDFGIYALALTVFRLVTMFTSVGQSAAVVRFGAERRQKPAEFGAVLRVAIGLGLVASTTFCVLLFACADVIATSVFNQPTLAPLLRFFALILPIWSLMDVCLAATMIDRKIAFAIGAEEVVQPILYLVLVILLVLLFKQLYALDAALWAALISFTAIALLALWVMVKRFPAVRQRTYTEANRGLSLKMIRYGIPISLASLLLWSSPLFDRLLMGVFSTPENAGTYVVVAQISTLFTLIGTAVDAIQGPLIANLIYLNNTPRLERITQSAVRIGLLIGIPALMILCVHGDTVLRIVFGAAYTTGASALFVLSAATFLRVISDRAIGLLTMSGYNRRWLTFTIIFSVFNIAFDALLIPKLGMVGSAIGTGIVNIFLLVALGSTTLNRLHVHLFNVSFLWFVPITLISVGAGMLPSWLGFHLSGFLDLIIFAALSSAVFLLLAWRFTLSDEEKTLLLTALNRLNHRIRKTR